MTREYDIERTSQGLDIHEADQEVQRLREALQELVTLYHLSPPIQGEEYRLFLERRMAAYRVAELLLAPQAQPEVTIEVLP